jgi:hypothetical protein
VRRPVRRSGSGHDRDAYKWPAEALACSARDAAARPAARRASGSVPTRVDKRPIDGARRCNTPLRRESSAAVGPRPRRRTSGARVPRAPHYSKITLSVAPRRRISWIRKLGSKQSHNEQQTGHARDTTIPVKASFSSTMRRGRYLKIALRFRTPHRSVPVLVEPRLKGITSRRSGAVGGAALGSKRISHDRLHGICDDHTGSRLFYRAEKKDPPDK